ncbi:PREDICTED: diphosphomevalonate decarboxylase-like [Amphimedon queenslandica]|uniref:Diphosphomevalonate decarboxylase n=1 Tax=Amphimedon queenslandica TaxID=400682 RepID=A0AAN0IAS0_AMPQE|nr:PREDICTED: diphosphomevalonate decarboxylase-like [Amphimedon queenslandica]|eukprot:XP_003383859.1 PREDICTED: diphosphomevalonate decarboxylase-like [Amphimedon queenslandica]
MAGIELKDRSFTCTAPVNIAVIKYWGKRNEELILPINSSLSVTLHQNELRAKTMITLSSSFDEDQMWLNDKEEDISNPRIQRCLREIRRLATKTCSIDPSYLEGHVQIRSENNFPTAAGLASSAAGYACLVYCLSQVYGLKDVDISVIARQGSGSACRSVYGGFVSWEKGEREDGEDSIAEQVCPDMHWPDLQVLILVVSEQKKTVSSTSGMRTSVETSSLINFRANNVVPARMDEMKQAIKEKDFSTFATLTMKDSNQFHAVCLDSYPPIMYMNDASKYIVQLVTAYNLLYSSPRLAYTFDAGPNAVLFTPGGNIGEILGLVQHYLPPNPGAENYIRGVSAGQAVPPTPSKTTINGIGLLPWKPGSLQYIIHTRVGPGPMTI